MYCEVPNTSSTPRPFNTVCSINEGMKLKSIVVSHRYCRTKGAIEKSCKDPLDPRAEFWDFVRLTLTNFQKTLTIKMI